MTMTNNPTIDGVSRVLLAQDREMRVYIAGPMTGIENYNFPAFNAMAEKMRAAGWHVENPADHGLVVGAEWGDYLRYDIGCLASCEAIMLLPGWTTSRGARLEVSIAKELGVAFMYAEGAENAPAVERQEPEYPAGAIHNGKAFIDQLESIYAFKEQQGHPLSLCSEWQELVRCFEWLATHATDSQSTIARLEAQLNNAINLDFQRRERIMQLESEKEFAAATYQAARDRIAELESGRGEPIYEQRYGGGWINIGLEEYKRFLEDPEEASSLRIVFTSPPAPVAVVLPDRATDTASCSALAKRLGLYGSVNVWKLGEIWNACLDATDALNKP